MKVQEELTEIGYVSKSHGFKGEVQLVLLSEMRIPKKAEFLFVWIDHGPVPFLVQRISQSGQSAIVKFEDVENENNAQPLFGKKLFIEKKYAGDEQEDGLGQNKYEGFSLYDKTHGDIGLLDEMIVAGAKKIFVLTRNGKEILIPAEKPIWVKTDKLKKIIYLNLPEGLLEVYS